MAPTIYKSMKCTTMSTFNPFDQPASSFEQAPTGNHAAILFRCIDLGTQDGEYEGKPTKSRKVWLEFELHSSKAKTDKGEPMTVGREFTQSSGERSGLRLFLEAWRGAKFTNEELATFDFKDFLGKAGLLNVGHSEKGRAKIVGIGELAEGMTPPRQFNNLFVFSLRDFNQDVYEKVPTFLKKKIELSPEYQGLNSATMADAIVAGTDAYEDSIPY